MIKDLTLTFKKTCWLW